MNNKTITILILLTITFFHSNAQTLFEQGYYDGFSKGYCFGGTNGCSVPETIAPKPTLIESESSYKDGFQKGFDIGFEKFEDKKSNSNSNSTNNRSYSNHEDFSVPLSMQNNEYTVDLKEFESQLIPRDYNPEFDNFNQKTEDIIRSLKSDLNSLTESQIPYISKKNQDSIIQNEKQNNRFIQNEKDKHMVKVWLLTILGLTIIVFIFKKWRIIMWFMLDTSHFLKPYYGLFVISSLITHGWTVLIAFTESGVWGGIFSLIIPGISEIYWMIKMLGQNNVYSIIALSQIVLIIPILNIRNVR